jgi:hypothetical protein
MASSPAPTTIKEREPKTFEPREIPFPKEVKQSINDWLYKNIESLLRRYKRQHSSTIKEYRRIIDGKPREKNKSFPFPNCSNLVAQLVGESVDELVAWVLQLIWVTQPLVYFRYPKEKDEEQAVKNSDKQKALETFFDNNACDPRKLNLYPFQNKWFTEAAGIGKGYLCVAPENRLEAVWTGYKENGGSKGKGEHEFENTSIYEGPKLINCRYEDILVNPDVDVFYDNDPIVRRCVLNARKIRERVFKGHFKSDIAKEVLQHPDRYGPDETRKAENQSKELTDSEDATMAEWDIYECYFSWFHNGRKFRLISWYHMGTKKELNCVFNFVPENQVPILEARLSVDGKGFAEMLKDSQDEVSTAKNQRNDAILYGMLGVNTIDKQNKDLDRNFTLNPGVFLPAKKDTFQHYNMADSAMAGLSLQNEQAMIMQAKSRAGVDPPISGAGAGSMGKNKQFGSMGTMAVLQTSNSRSAHRTSGFRHASVRLYAMLTDFYGFMELGDTALVKEALKDYLERKMQIPVRAADASMNKEVTKQNEIILNQAVAAFIKEVSSLIQAYQNPSAGDATYKKWLRAIIIGRVRMFQQVVKDFQLTDNPAEFIPDIELAPVPEEPQNAKPAQGGPAGSASLPKVAEIIQRARAGGVAGGVPGMGGAPGGPQIPSGGIGA